MNIEDTDMSRILTVLNGQEEEITNDNFLKYKIKIEQGKIYIDLFAEEIMFIFDVKRRFKEIINYRIPRKANQ